MAQHPTHTLMIGAFCAALAARAQAAEELAPASNTDGWSADVELDPLAYAAGGHSVHVGLGRGRVRVDLGAFAADIPEWLQQVDGFDVRSDGFGMKLDVFLQEDWSGPFAGVEAGLLGTTLRSPAGDHDFDRSLLVGGRAGWRIPLGAGFYATPWLGVDYAIGAGDRNVGAYRYEQSPWVLFPTLHVGYRVR
jgi:hypothetical protein